jgi:GTP-binding protein LepA
MPEKVSKSEL